MNVKIAISGQPDTGKTKLFSQLKKNPWFVSKHAVFESNNILDQIDEEQFGMSQYYLVDSYVEKILKKLNTEVAVYDKSIVDTLPAAINKGRQGQCPGSIISTILVKINYHLNLYDKIYVILDPKKPLYDEYTSVKNLLSGKNNLEFIEGQTEKNLYNKIILESKEILENKQKQKNENSNQWFATFGKDLFNPGS